MNSIREIASTLHAALNSDAMFSLVNTRITLRTGIDLRNQEDLTTRDTPTNTANVLEVLKTIGYSPEALQAVARTRVRSR